MQIDYYGANCVVITTKKTKIIFDDNLQVLGLKSVTKPDDIAIFTSVDHPDSKAGFVIDSPGEFEVKNISIKGVSAQKHIDTEGKNAIIYQITSDDIRVGVLGNIKGELSEKQQEELGQIDILVIPVGGSGYTLDPISAKKLVKTIDPKVFVPIHYADKSIKYEVPQIDIETVSKEMAFENPEHLDTFKVKSRDAIGDHHRAIILERK